MPLALDDRDVLPVGIHDANLDEVEELFGRWNRCDRRPDLFSLFSNYVAAVRRTGWACVLVIDGSFVMARVDDPDDIDVLLGYPPEVDSQIETNNLRPYQLNVLDSLYCKRTYKIDLEACTVESGVFGDRVALFTQVSMKRADKHGLPAGSQKGLVRVIL